MRARARFRVASSMPEAAAAGASGSDPVAEIVQIARDVAPEGGYGETAWNPGTSTVYWVPADWTTNDELDLAHAAFLDIDGVKQVEGDAESALPTGDGWEQVFPEPGSEEAYERVLALAMRPLDVVAEHPARGPGLVSDGRLRLAERALDTVDGVLRLARER